MNAQRFNPESDLAPMPFDKRVCLKALEMKKNHLAWRPHVGCFVWDPEEIIKAASPFPGRIYFILRLARFIEIFDTIDQITAKLVWLPTWHQAQLIYRKLAGTDAVMDHSLMRGHRVSSVEELLYIYDLITDALKAKDHQMPSQN